MNGCINMINNQIYRESLEQVLSAIEVSNASFLVTGASGLIGSCLIDLLMLANRKGLNNKVYALGRSREKLESRFPDYIGNPNFEVIEQNICQPLDDSLQFDYILHGASNADPISYAKYPVETMTTNIMGAYNVLEYGRKHASCKILLMSTFEVYGNTGSDVYAESEAGVIDFNAFRACYPESKRSMEILSRSYVSEYNVNVRVARLSSIYGPTMAANDSKAHAQFLRNAMAGKDIVLKSEGLPRRTYTYVVDAVTGLLCVLFYGKVAESYNISNENAIASIAEVAKICAEIAGTKVIFDIPSELETKGFSKPQNCILDNNKLKSLGWRGSYTVKKGFSECYNILKS